MTTGRSIVIFGAGAVGGYLGAKLMQGGTAGAVTLVGRQAMVEAVRSQGLMLREAGESGVARPAATSSIADLPACDLVILTVRAYDVERSLPEVQALLGNGGLLLAMQNGVGSEELLAGALGRDCVLAGALTVSAGMEQPGIVTRYSRQGGVALSTMSGAPVPPWITAAFQDSGLPTMVLSDYRSLRWSKLLLNMIGAATTAVLDIDMTALVNNAALFRVEQLALREAVRVMDAQHIQIVRLPGYPVPRLRLVMQLPRRLAQRLLGPRIGAARGGRAPSMRADMARGQTEVTFLNGAVAEAADRLGIRAPVNAALSTLTLQLVRNPKRRAEFSGRPDALLDYLAGYDQRPTH
jgi:2-dehydropantoate 2-reductase